MISLLFHKVSGRGSSKRSNGGLNPSTAISLAAAKRQDPWSDEMPQNQSGSDACNAMLTKTCLQFRSTAPSVKCQFICRELSLHKQDINPDVRLSSHPEEYHAYHCRSNSQGQGRLLLQHHQSYAMAYRPARG